MTNPPYVTIAMPCYNEEGHIEACLRAVQAQDYPRDKIEILVADGMSIDGTREILLRLARDDARIRVIDNPDRIQAPGLNAIIREARGEVIVRMDVHADYAPDYVRKCCEVLERTGADNVGGPMRTSPRSPFQRALRAALSSPLGVGGAAYRNADREGFVDTVYLGAFRKAVFERVGLYDPGAVTNEDAELNQRIVRAGGRVYLSPEIVVHYVPRASMTALAKQYFKYGRGRARTLLKHRTFLRLRPALPFLFVAGESVMLAIPALHGFGIATLCAYLLATGVEAIRVGRSEGLSAIPKVWAIFPVLHVSHGVGFAAGLLRYSLSPDWSEPELLSQRDQPPVDVVPPDANGVPVGA